MKDFLQDCMEDFRRKAKLTTAVSPVEFKELFCSHCKQQCVNALHGDPLARRAATQFDRLVHAKQVNPDLPKYASIVGAGWVDKTLEEINLAISARRNDWEVPILDGTPLAATPARTEVVDSAVRQLAQAKGQKAPKFPDSVNKEVWARAEGLAGKKADKVDYVQVIYDRLMSGVEEDAEEVEEQAPVEPAPQHPKKHPGFRPQGRGNAVAQGGMIGGAPKPKHEPAPDPWAAPDPKVTGQRVNPGAVIKFGADGKIIK